MSDTPADRTSRVSVVVLTFNEEANLGACLESLAGWHVPVFIVDSGSTDATVAIAQRFGATVVTHPFDTHTRQWAWALRELPLVTPWVLAIDADQRLTRELRDEIDATLATNPAVTGYYLKRRQVFRGRWIRHGGYYPKFLLKLFTRADVSLDDGDLVDHHFSVNGATANLRYDMIEDNANEARISVWTAKHNRYAVLQARQEWTAAARATRAVTAAPGSPDAQTQRMKQTWARLPLFVRPVLYVLYRYIVRLGFLDGKEGFIFHVLQGFWYRLLVDINIDELRAEARAHAEAERAATKSSAKA